MPFHRFEDYGSSRLAPHLSSIVAPVIEGRYMEFCMVSNEAGTGSDFHCHPNELLVFPVEGKLNAIVGKDRRIVALRHLRARARLRAPLDEGDRGTDRCAISTSGTRTGRKWGPPRTTRLRTKP